MKAKITRTGKSVGYRWQVGRIYGFTVTRWGAVYAAKKYANELRHTRNQKAEEIEV